MRAIPPAALCFLFLVSGALRAAEELPLREIDPSSPAKKDGSKKDAIRHVTIQAAIAGAREKYAPFLIVFDGGAEYRPREGDVPTSWNECTTSASFRRALEKITVCRVRSEDLRKPYPAPPRPAGERPPGVLPDADAGEAGKGGEPAKPDAAAKTVAAQLGLVDGVPAVVFVDYRERVIRRLVDSLPRRTKLRGMILSFAVKNATLARYARRAEKILERSRYAYELGKRRTAVQQVIPFERPAEQKKMDPVLLARANELISRYRKDAQRIVDRGNALDRQKDYVRALQVFEEVSRDYPFPDIIRVASQKRGEILRKAQLGI